MSAKEQQPMPEMFRRTGNEGHVAAARPPAPVAPPRQRSKASPTFLTLKNIIMDDESISDEQKLNLIDKISELY